VLAVRERKSLTQAEFADLLGCSVFSVSKWECGETAPSAPLGFPPSEWPRAAGVRP
jgi:DNA-binding transcriptional regulator YiaG